MSQYRMLVTYHNPSEPTAANDVVNTFYLDTDALGGADDPQGLAEDAATLWATYKGQINGLSECQVRAYDMSHAEPREPVGDATADVTSFGGAGPREVALCLSYYADRNLPRRRGRMYIGPWWASQMAERPSLATRQLLQTLAEGISGLGGVNVQWVQYSPTTGQFQNVTDYWIDDEWDTVRSRGLEGEDRLAGTVSG